MSESEQDNTIEQLLELLVYAPVGLLYEYEDVLPQLIRRGKSQVQLAKVFGQMAASQERQGNGPSPADALSGLASVMTKLAGEAFSCSPEPASEADPASPASDLAEDLEIADEPTAAAPSGTRADSLPIAGYDALTAKEIIGLLSDLTADQRAEIAAYEQANRARKTVLGKLERLAE